MICVWGDPARGVEVRSSIDGMLRWTAPGAVGDSGQAVAYEIRVSQNPPTGSALSWWNAALPQDDVPSPGPPGTDEVWQIPDLNPSRTVYAAVRSVNDNGLWSSVSTIAAFTVPSAPFLQGASPSEVRKCGTVGFTISGVALSGAGEVRLKDSANGNTYTANRVRALGDGSLWAIVNIPQQPFTVFDVEVDTPGGTDALRGWVTFSPPEQGCAASAPDAGCLGVSANSGGWQISVCSPGTPGSSAAVQEPRIQVFDVTGRLVARPSASQVGDVWISDWEGLGINGRRLPRGIFFLRVISGGQVFNQKLLVTG